MRHHFEYQLVKQVLESIEYFVELIAEEDMTMEDEEIVINAGTFFELDYFNPDEHDEWLIYFKSVAEGIGDNEKVLAQLSTNTVHHLAVLFFTGLKLLKDLL